MDRQAKPETMHRILAHLPRFQALSADQLDRVATSTIRTADIDLLVQSR